MLHGDIGSIGPSLEPSAPATPSGTGADGALVTASRDDQSVSSIGLEGPGDARAAGDEGGDGSSNEDVAALNARLDALQATLELLQQDLAVAPTYEAQTPSPFSVLRDSPLLAALVYPPMLLMSYLSWRAVPIGMLLFALLGWFFPAAWWYGWFLFLSALTGGVFIAYTAQSPGMETFRRRMLVYGIAFCIWCDYRIVRKQTEHLDEQESDIVWSLAHKRCVRPARVRSSDPDVVQVPGLSYLH